MASNFNLSDDGSTCSSSSETNDLDLLNEEFQNAADRLQLIHSALPNDVLLILYSLYKQATVGECNIPKPNIFNSQGRAKWNAWSNLGKMSQIEAKQKYIEKLYSVDTEHTPLKTKANKNFSFICQSQLVNSELPLNDTEKNVFDYVKENNIEKFKSVFQHDDKVNILGEEGLGLIHWAADRNSADILHFLLENKADVNLKDEDGQTALHYASSCGNLDCISILMKYGADKELIDLAGMTCFDVAFDDEVRSILRSSLFQ